MNPSFITDPVVEHSIVLAVSDLQLTKTLSSHLSQSDSKSLLTVQDSREQLQSVTIAFNEVIELAQQSNDTSALFPLIRENIIGKNAVFQGPFGLRKIVYADYFASGKPLEFIETHIVQHVLPFYANTHTDATFTGKKTGELREESRLLIKKAINGYYPKTEQDCSIIFCGTGSTAGLNKLVHIFKLKDPLYWRKSFGLKKKLSRVFKPGQESSKSKVSSKDRPVVFMSVQEHHANILPWRNTVADVVFINDTNGLICLQNLKEKLDQYKNRPLKIGTFTAGSNVVGIIQPVDDISVLLHQYGAYAIFDYAGVGAYVPIDMNPSNPLAYKDAIVLSPHKMIGGPQTPGILSLRNSSFSKFTKNGYYPNNVGGGIVQFVGFESHLLINDLEQLEEAGTPAIIESIRAGLVFQLKNTIGSELIQKMEIEHFRFAKNRFEKYPNILILGDLENDRIPVFSFLIKHNERYFHYNFITTALNDLFGIQTRGGCMCAGPFASKLLNLDDRTMENYGKIITGKMWVNVKPMESFKPGFTRLSLNYFISDEEIKYIIDSVIWISENASKIISFYDFCLETGNWQVSSVNLETIALEQSASAEQALGQSECFTFADMIAKKREAKRVIGTFKDAYEFRWFVLPEDLQ